MSDSEHEEVTIILKFEVTDRDLLVEAYRDGCSDYEDAARQLSTLELVRSYITEMVSSNIDYDSAGLHMKHSTFPDPDQNI